ncbi:MAG: hypothetical protein ACFFEU_06580 [Candidatus Thorarchaeota archaeon]
MILRVYIMKSPSGEPIYGRSYDDSDPIGENSLPEHVRACATLFHTSSGTSRDRVYTLEQAGAIWSYVFFENFAVILFTTFDENEVGLKKMMMSLGRAISNQFGGLISSWTGNIGEFEGMDLLVDRYVTIDLEHPPNAILDNAEKLMNAVLEDHEIAYVGLLDARGELLRGNIPENHLSGIEAEMMANGEIRPVADMVPTGVEIMGYSVQLLRVQSLTVAVAAHRDESRLAAIKAVSEIADDLNRALSN